MKDHTQVILKEEQDLEDQNIIWSHVEFLVSLRTKEEIANRQSNYGKYAHVKHECETKETFGLEINVCESFLRS